MSTALCYLYGAGEDMDQAFANALDDADANGTSVTALGKMTPVCETPFPMTRDGVAAYARRMELKGHLRSADWGRVSAVPIALPKYFDIVYSTTTETVVLHEPYLNDDSIERRVSGQTVDELMLKHGGKFELLKSRTDVRGRPVATEATVYGSFRLCTPHARAPISGWVFFGSLS